MAVGKRFPITIEFVKNLAEFPHFLFCNSHLVGYDYYIREDGNSGRGSEMNKVKMVKGITKLYFAGALTGSFIHIVIAAEKLGGSGVEAYATPFMIDGIAIIGMVMRGEEFSTRTNKIGFRVQCVMGAMSLAMNVYAAHSLFGVLFGIAIVGLFVFAEWLKDQIEGREVDEVAQAQQAIAWQAACSHPTKCGTAERCASKTAATAKAKKTNAKKARVRKAQEKALESLLEQPVVEPGVRVLKAA